MQNPELKLDEKIEPDYELLYDLQSHDLLTNEERKEVSASRTASRRVACLLSHLAEKSHDILSKFPDILKKSYQEHVFSYILHRGQRTACECLCFA
jgi:CRP-like cAMP-binding protein